MIITCVYSSRMKQSESFDRVGFGNIHTKTASVTYLPSFIFPAQTQKQTGHLLPGGLTPPTHILESIGIACHLVMFKVLSRGLGLLHFYVESKTIQKYKK